jgi:hypothetical protein
MDADDDHVQYQGIAGPEEVERDDDGEDVIEVDGAEEGEFLNTQR